MALCGCKVIALCTVFSMSRSTSWDLPPTSASKATKLLKSSMKKPETYLCSYAYLLFARSSAHCITVHCRNCRGHDGHSRWRIQWSYWQHLTWPEPQLVCVTTATACTRSCSDTWLQVSKTRTLKLGKHPPSRNILQPGIARSAFTFKTSYCNRNGPSPSKELQYCAENLAGSSGPVLWASRLNNCPCWTPWLDNLCSRISAAPFQLPYSEASWCTAKGVSRSFPKNISNIKPSPFMRGKTGPKWQGIFLCKLSKW